MMLASIRPSLRWALAATVLASSVAWLAPRGASQRGQPVVDAAAPPSPSASGGSTPPSTAGVGSGVAPRFTVGPAEADPFAIEQAAASKASQASSETMPKRETAGRAVATPEAASNAQPQPSAPPPPAPPPVGAAVQTPAPAVQHRFFGRFATPDGQTQVYLTRTGAPVLAAPGTTLDDGYVVETVRSDALKLVYLSGAG